MSASLKKTVVGSLAALAIGISAIVTVAPASAAPLPAHGGHIHGGGGPRFHGGGGWHGGSWGPAAVGLGVLGLAAGAALAAPGYYGDYGDNGCQAYRPVYDGYGNFLGRRLVNVC
jgi:hypothetical protein